MFDPEDEIGKLDLLGAGGKLAGPEFAVPELMMTDEAKTRGIAAVSSGDFTSIDDCLARTEAANIAQKDPAEMILDLPLAVEALTMAAEVKARGNAGDFTSAVRSDTEAIKLTPTIHALYSNRSAAHASLHLFADALSDVEKTVELKSYWPKEYNRLGAALVGLGQF